MSFVAWYTCVCFEEKIIYEWPEYGLVAYSGQGVGLATPKVAGSTPCLALLGNNLGQVVYTHVRLSTKQYNLVSAN